MTFESVIGQQRVKKMILSALDRQRLAHGYLFHGPPGVGKDLMGIRIAMGLNCENLIVDGCGQCNHCRQTLRLEHPSFRFVLPVPSRPKSMKAEKYNELVRGKNLERINNPYREIFFTPEINGLPSISIEQIRSLKQEVILKQQRSRYRVFLISHADQMTLPASNSLLKLLEEPPSGTLLFLTTSIPKRILPTIISRCQTVRFDALSNDAVEKALIDQWNLDENKARFLARLSNGSLQRVFSLIDEHFEERRTAALSFLESSLHKNHLKRLEVCDTLIQDLEKTGVQSMLELLKTYLRDLLCLQTGVPDKLINPDQEKALNRLLEQYHHLDIQSAMTDVEHAIASLKKNVYLNLIIHVLSQKLNALAKKRSQD